MATEAEKTLERKRAQRQEEWNRAHTRWLEAEAAPCWTVRQLANALLALTDQDAPIQSEGCDCYGEVKGIKRLGDGYVLMRMPVEDGDGRSS